MLPSDLQSTQKGLETYFNATLALPIRFESWAKASDLPQYLRQKHAFLAGEVLGTPCLFMIDQGAEPTPPNALAKQMLRIQTDWHGLVVHVRDSLTTHQRRRLIEHHIPFVVPGTQLFLPHLAIDLREQFARLNPAPAHLDPSAQVLILLAILNRVEQISLTEATERCGYTKMTMGRAFDAAESLKLAARSKQGRERVLHFAFGGIDLWNAAKPYLRSPVLRTVPVLDLVTRTPTPMAGESALATQTSLAPPPRRVLAMGAAQWTKVLDAAGIRSVEDPYDGNLDIEIWRYPPQRITDSELVDPLSLMLSLGNSADPRVQIAVDELAKSVEW